MKTGTKILAAAGGAVAAWAALSYAAVRKVFSIMFPHWMPDNYSTPMRFKDLPSPIERREVRFFSGKNMLRGFIYGEDNDKGLIVVSHGILSCHEDYLSGIIELVNRGWTVFGFNNTGSFTSEGKDMRGLVQGPLDLHAALCYIEDDPVLSKKKIFLYGHSQGGYSVCSVLNFRHKIDGVVSVSGFTTPYAVTSELGKKEYGKVISLTYPMVRFEYFRRFGKYANLSAVKGINRYDGPVLIMHGVGDTYVNYHGASLINNRSSIKNPKVRYVDLEYPERTGHDDMFISLEAKHYCRKVWEKCAAAMKEYGVNDRYKLPKQVLDEIFADVDKAKASEINKEFFDTVDNYLTKLL